MDGLYIAGSEAGAQTPPLLRASSPLKPKINRELTLRLVQRTGALQPLSHIASSERTHVNSNESNRNLSVIAVGVNYFWHFPEPGRNSLTLKCGIGRAVPVSLLGIALRSPTNVTDCPTYESRSNLSDLYTRL